MGVHDWRRVRAGVFHDFHTCWIAAIRSALNDGVLPPDYYALAEQQSGEAGADVLPLKSAAGEHSRGNADSNGGTAVKVAPPEVRFTASLEVHSYASRTRRIVIRHSSDDRMIAVRSPRWRFGLAIKPDIPPQSAGCTPYMDHHHISLDPEPTLFYSVGGFEFETNR